MFNKLLKVLYEFCLVFITNNEVTSHHINKQGECKSVTYKAVNIIIKINGTDEVI